MKRNTALRIPGLFRFFVPMIVATLHHYSKIRVMINSTDRPYQIEKQIQELDSSTEYEYSDIFQIGIEPSST